MPFMLNISSWGKKRNPDLLPSLCLLFRFFICSWAFYKLVFGPLCQLSLKLLSSSYTPYKLPCVILDFKDCTPIVNEYDFWEREDTVSHLFVAFLVLFIGFYILLPEGSFAFQSCMTGKLYSINFCLSLYCDT